VETVEDVKRLGAFLANHVEVRLPHVGAKELDLRGQLCSNEGEEALEAFHRPLSADPEESRHALVNLVDQGEVLVPLGVLNFVDANGADRAELAMLQAPAHHVLDRIADLFPGGMKGLGRFFPGEFSRPSGQKQQCMPW